MLRPGRPLFGRVGEGVDWLIDATDAVKDTTVTVSDVVGGRLAG
jgi:hypothetical protein